MSYFLSKFEATGNDFLLLEHSSPLNVPLWVPFLCDRKRGIGADGVLVVTRRSEIESRMVIYNADGSRPEMCGNGVRCVAAYMKEKYEIERLKFTTEVVKGRPEEATIKNVSTDVGQTETFSRSGRPLCSHQLESQFTVISDAGPRIVSSVSDTQFRVDMGRPRFLTVPLVLSFEGEPLSLYCVNMGNPHAVLFDSGRFNQRDLWELGSFLNQGHPAFPEGVNLEVVDVDSVRKFQGIQEDTESLGIPLLPCFVFERGVGETLACGTGACAVAVAARLNGLIQTEAVYVQLPGGKLLIEWSCLSGVNDKEIIGEECLGEVPVMMTGEVRKIAEITLSPEWVSSLREFLTRSHE